MNINQQGKTQNHLALLFVLYARLVMVMVWGFYYVLEDEVYGKNENYGKKYTH